MSDIETTTIDADDDAIVAMLDKYLSASAFRRIVDVNDSRIQLLAVKNDLDASLSFVKARVAACSTHNDRDGVDRAMVAQRAIGAKLSIVCNRLNQLKLLAHADGPGDAVTRHYLIYFTESGMNTSQPASAIVVANSPANAIRRLEVSLAHLMDVVLNVTPINDDDVQYFQESGRRVFDLKPEEVDA